MVALTIVSDFSISLATCILFYGYMQWNIRVMYARDMNAYINQTVY